MSASKVAILTILYNPENYLNDYLQAIQKIDYPEDALLVYFLDNSNDTSAKSIIEDSPSKFRLSYKSSEKNLGFSGGNNYLFAELVSEGFDYYFLLNQDTKISSDCIRRLVEVAEAVPTIGMIEALQTPNEHPKYYDPETGETSWCSGGGVLIRKQALEEVGYFDDNFFMYCEDVDLSWRMWIAGWECRVNPKASYFHETEELDTGKDHSIRYYYSFRNAQLINIKYNSLPDGLRFYFTSWLSVFLKNRKYFRIRLKALLAAHYLMAVYLLRRIKNKQKIESPWINFTRLSFGLKRPEKQ